MSGGSDLAVKHCKSCEGGKALAAAQADKLLRGLAGWGRRGGEISKSYKFENYYQTMAFVNAIAWMAHQENHHPDLEVGYNRVGVRYSTHSVGGLSENDFICAAKVEGLIAGPA